MQTLVPGTKDQKKTFGVPSIRSDLNNQSQPSIASLVNFGNDPDAYELLYPNANAGMGLNDKDFASLFTKEEVN